MWSDATPTCAAPDSSMPSTDPTTARVAPTSTPSASRCPGRGARYWRNSSYVPSTRCTCRRRASHTEAATRDPVSAPDGYLHVADHYGVALEGKRCRDRDRQGELLHGAEHEHRAEHVEPGKHRGHRLGVLHVAEHALRHHRTDRK